MGDELLQMLLAASAALYVRNDRVAIRMTKLIA
jgi:hypothetical protein